MKNGMQLTKRAGFEDIKLLLALSLTMLVLILSACGQESNQNEVSVSNDTLSAPLPSALLTVDETNLMLDVVVDGGTPQTCANLSVDQVNGTYSCDITLSGGPHTISLIYSIIDATYGTVQVATTSGINIDVVPGQTASADFSTVPLTYDDDDSDGISNLDELDEGSDPNVASYYVGGTVTGLLGSNFTLQMNGYDLNLTSDGEFKFTPAVADNTDYNVTVLTQPSGPNQTCTVTNGTGTVAGSDITSVAVNCSVNSYTIGGTLTGLAGGSVVLQQSGDDDLTLSTNASFSFATPVNDGDAYNVTVLTHPSGPNQICTVTNGNGTVAGNDVTDVSVVCVNPPLFVYVANQINDNVTTFSIDPGTGALTEVGTEVAAGNDPLSVTVDPSGRFAYVANSLSDDVTTFSIDPDTGALTEVGTEVEAGLEPRSVTVDPIGRFVYVANQTSNDVTTFSINPSTGALTEVGTEVTAGTGPRSVTVEPSGRFAYVANNGSDNVTTFSINPGTGALTKVGTEVAAGSTPTSVTVDPSGRFAYVASDLSNDVTTFSINPGTGALSKAGTEVATGSTPFSVTVDPTGRFAYVANKNSDDVTTFSINPGTGALTEVGTAVPAGTNPQSVTVDPSGRFAYVANINSNDVTTFSINPGTGALTEVGTAVPAGSTPSSVTVDPTGRFAYVANADTNKVTTFSIDPGTGALTKVGTEVEAGLSPNSITVLGGSR